MPGTIGPNLGLTSGWAAGEAAWGTAMNENLRKLDAVVHLSVVSATTASPAASPAEGARYLVPTAPAGEFLGQANKIAVRYAGAWVFLAPVNGWTLDAQDTGRRWRFNGTAWQDALAAQPYTDISNTGGWTLPNGTAWTKVQLFTKTTDTDGAWNTSNWSYTVPITGVYMVQVTLRPNRSGANAMPANTNLAVVFSTAAADGIDAVSATSTDLLDFTLTLNKPMWLTRNTNYAVFAKHSGAGPITFTYAQLKLVRIAVA